MHPIGTLVPIKTEIQGTKIGTLEDIAAVVEDSVSVNYVQLVGKSNGTILVPSYDWSSLFADTAIQTSLKGISKLHILDFVPLTLVVCSSVTQVMT